VLGDLRVDFAIMIGLCVMVKYWEDKVF